MTTDDDLREAEQRARAHSQAEERLLAALEKRKDDSLNTVIQRKGLARLQRQGHDDLPIRSYPARFYALPASLRKLLSAEAAAEFESLLAIVKDANDDMVGVPLAIACARFDGDDLVKNVRNALRAWADRYVRSRIEARARAERGRPEDSFFLPPSLGRNEPCHCGSGRKYKNCHLGPDDQRASEAADPLAEFKGLLRDLFPLVERVGGVTASVHGVFINDFASYAPWAAYHNTWASRVRVYGGTDLNPTNVSIDFPPAAERECQRQLELFQWGHADDLSRAYRVMRRAGLPALDAPDKARARLRSLASDIVEMRPFLIEDDDSVQATVEVAPALWASWSWGGGQTLGHVPVAESKDELLEQIAQLGFHTRLQVSYEGVFSSDAAPWLDAEALGERDGPARDAQLLAPLHDRLYAMYGKKVDLEAEREKAQELAELTDENVAVTCQIDAKAEAEKTPEIVAPDEPRPRIPQMRLKRFLELLRKLGCEVTSAKGSEVKIYRPTGRIMVVGRHQSNREVPSMLVRRVLERVGVSFREWLGVLQG